MHGGARIVQWWHHVAYTPADLAYARLTRGLTPGRLDADIGAAALASIQFCPSPASIGEADESGADSVYTEVQVPARIVGAAAEPNFPASLIRENTSGAITVSYVVGINGLVEPGSIRPIGRMEAELLMSVRDAMRGWRFTPALVDGHPVRSRLEHRFTFRIIRMEPNIP